MKAILAKMINRRKSQLEQNKIIAFISENEMKNEATYGLHIDTNNGVCTRTITQIDVEYISHRTQSQQNMRTEHLRPMHLRFYE